MTTYRVGTAGATVFNAKGEVVGALPAGHVVVEGVIEIAGSLAEQHQKMVRRYSDKALSADREYSDKVEG